MNFINYKEIISTENKKLKNYFKEAQLVRKNNFNNKIQFYAPSFMHYKMDSYCPSQVAFPSVSITGSDCSLKCKHCAGIVLRTMFPASSPEKLYGLCEDLKSRGAVGCLISGGCSHDGTVPMGDFSDVIGRIKRELGLILVVHTGVINEKISSELKKANIDAVLIDIIGSDETIHDIYNLDLNVGDYRRSLQLLKENNIPFVPHVLVGLHYGQLKGELDALKIISDFNPSALIIIAFMPIRGTAMENVSPPLPIDIARVLIASRLMMPSTPLVLGCMRPKGKHRKQTDVLALQSGVNAIAYPSDEVVKLSKFLNYETSFSPSCCSQIFLDINQKTL